MDTNSIQNPVGDSLKNKRSKRKERKKANKTASNDMINILIQLDSTARSESQVEQSKMDTGSIENIAEWTVLRKKKRRKQKKKKAKNEGELQSMDQMDDHLEVPAIGKLCIVANNDLQNNLIELDSTVQSHAEQSRMDTRSTENVTKGIEGERTEGTVQRKKRKKKQNKKKAKNDGEFQSMDQRNALYVVDLQNNITELDSTAQLHEELSRSTENISEETVQRKKRRKHKKMKAKNKDELRGVDQMDDNLEVPNVDIGCRTVVNSDLQNNLIELDSTAQSHAEQSKMDIRLTENLIEGTMQRKRRRRKQNKNKAKIKDELQSLDQMDDNLEAPSIGIGINCDVANNNLQNNFIELDSTAQSHAEQSKMGTRSTENFAEGLVQRKRRWRKHNKKRANTKDELQSVNCMSSLSLSDINHGIGNDGKLITNESTTPSLHLVNGTMSHVGLGKQNKTSLATVDVDSKSYSEFIEQGSGPSDGPREMEVEMFSCESRHIRLPNEMYGKNEKIENEYSEEEIIVYEGKDSAVSSSYDVDVTKQLYSPILKQDHLANDSSPYLEIAPVASVRRKLLVLDVNGLLADIVMPAPTDCIADTHLLGRAVFRRPFCDDFLKFCFENFDVAIWSSRSKKIIEKVVNYLLGDQQHKLLFCWDISQSTQTRFRTLENMHKPLVMKELKKIWEKDDPNLPWEKGYYNESNTLLLDDSPYKALLNPLHTAIFPYSYHYKDKSDNSLGPGGNLRVYLEDMLKCDNVKKYVEQHPFGQGAIDETNEFWSFYSSVLESLSAISV